MEQTAHATILSALDLDAPQVLVGGKTYRRVLRSVGSYYTMAQRPVSIERTRTKVAGKRNAETVDAVSLRGQVVGDGWLPVTAAAMA